MGFEIVKLVDPIQFTNVTGGLVPRGTYNGATDYAVGDSVDYNGSSYVMFNDATAGTLPTNTTYWQVLASKGSAGATGATGATGPSGLVHSVVAGTNVTVDSTDPANPIVSSSGGGGGGFTLTRTAVKTANYTAAANELVPVDTTSGNVQITPPTAPADGTILAVKNIIQGGTNVVTVVLAGSDVYNRIGGATTTTLTLLAQGILMRYSSATAIWTILADDLPLSQLDLRFIKTSTYAALATGLLKNTTATGVPTIAVAGTDYVAPGGSLGTPSSGTLTNATGLPLSTGISGLGTGVSAFLATPSSANLATAITDETGSGALVFGTSPSFTTPILGTPTSGTLINTTGLPISTGLTGMTNGTFLTATGTSSAASVKTAPAGTVLGTTDTQTLTNKRITRRTVATTQAAAPAINTDVTDVSQITGLAQAVISMTTNLTGTPVNRDVLTITYTDNGTARAITHGASFVSSGVALLLTTTVVGKNVSESLVWDAAISKWVCQASDQIGY